MAVFDLLVLNGSRAGACFSLPGVPTVLGRSPEAHLRLDDPWISNMHALFEPRGQELWVVDLGSRNGTFLGTERIEESQVTVGAVLSFGRTEVRLEPRGTASQRTADPDKAPIRTEEIRATVRTGRSTTDLPAAHLPAGEADPFLFALRPLALLRLSLSVVPGRPPPDATSLRSACDVAARVVRRHGGRTTRLGSAALVAVFGFGGPASDDAARALRAAEEVRDDLLTLAPDLAPRLAVDAGPSVAGMVSGPEGAELVALGEAPDRVERLVGATGPGDLLVGPGVSAGADPRLEPVPEAEAAGLAQVRRLRVG